MGISRWRLRETSCAFHNIDPVIKNKNYKKMPKKLWNFYRACEQCSYRTTLPFMIDDHRKKHKVHRNSKIFDCTKSTLEKYKCTVCSVEYATLNQVLFKRHMKNVHGIQLGRQYETENIQDITYSCRHCDFKTYSQMLHIIHYSKCYVKSAVVENEVESFKCSKCSYHTNREKLLDDHKRRKHPVFVDYKQKTGEPVGNMVRLLLCDWCDFFTMKKSILKKHMLNRHDARENDDVMYACKECSFKTKLQVDLYNHVRNTHICGKFTCKYCPYYSNRKQLLDIHMATYPHFDSEYIEYISSSESTSDVEITENESSKSSEPALFLKQSDKQLGSDQREDNEEITYLGSSEELSISSGSCDVEENLPLSIFSKSQNLETGKCKQPALFLEQSDKELESGKREENEDITYLGSSEELSISSGSYDAKKNLPLSIFSKYKNLETDKCKQPALFLELSDKELESGKREENEDITYLGSSEELSISSGSYDAKKNLPLSIFSKSKNLETDKCKQPALFLEQSDKELESGKREENEEMTYLGSSEVLSISCGSCDVEENLPLSIFSKSQKETEKSKEPALFLGKPEKELKSGQTEENEETIYLVFSEGSPISSELSDSEENQTPKSIIISKSQNLETSKCDKMYTCELCSRQYTFKVALMNHMFKKHPARAEQIYFKCPKCRFRATTHSILNRHVQIHHNSEVIKCDRDSIKEKSVSSKEKQPVTLAHFSADSLSNVNMIENELVNKKFSSKTTDKSKDRRFFPRQPDEVIDKKKYEWGIENEIITLSSSSSGQLSIVSKSFDDEENQSLSLFKQSKELETFKSDEISEHPTLRKDVYLKCPKCHFRTITEKLLKTHLRRDHKIKFIELTIDNTLAVEIMENGLLKKKSSLNATDESDESLLKRSDNFIQKNIHEQGLKDEERTTSDSFEEPSISSRLSDIEENQPLSVFSNSRNLKISKSDKIHKCKVCPSQYDNEIALVNHMLHKHPTLRKDTYLKCSKCHFRTLTEKLLKAHLHREHKIKFIEWATDNTSAVKIMENKAPKKKSPLNTTDESGESHKKILEQALKDKEKTSSDSLEELTISSSLSDIEESHQPLSVFSNSKNPDISKSNNMYKCTLCSSKYLLETALVNHMFLKHPTVAKEVYIKCPKCDFRTAWLKLLKTHIRREHKIKFIECGTDITSNVEMMEKNSSLNTTDKSEDIMSSDSHCSSDSEENQPFLVFPNSKDLQISKCDKMYKCNRCSSQYVLKETLMKHMFYKHPKTANLQCSKCRFQTTTVQSLKEHLKSEHKKVIGCGTNNKERKKQERKRNIKQRCIDLQPRVVLERLNIQPPIIQEVEKNRRKNDQRLEQKQAANNEGTKRLKCESCAFKSIDCSELKWHILTAHVAAEPVVCFKCQLCTFRTIEGKKLNEHILEKHIDPLSLDCFSCELCTNKYQKAEDLKKHIFEKHIL